MKPILSLLGLGLAIAAPLSSCSAPASSNALRTNDGIPIYSLPERSNYGGSSSGSC